MIELADLEHLDETPSYLLSPTTRVIEAIDRVAPKNKRWPIAHQPDVEQLAKEVRDLAGKKAVKRFIREEHYQLVAVFKEAHVQGRSEFGQRMLPEWALGEMRVRYDPRFDQFNSSMHNRILFEIMIHHEWWS